MHYGDRTGSKFVPKIRCLKVVKFDSRVHGSSYFEVPRSGKTMKDACQNHAKIEHQLKNDLGPVLERFWEPSWGPNGGQEASKTDSKFD